LQDKCGLDPWDGGKEELSSILSGDLSMSTSEKPERRAGRRKQTQNEKNWGEGRRRSTARTQGNKVEQLPGNKEKQFKK